MPLQMLLCQMAQALYAAIAVGLLKRIVKQYITSIGVQLVPCDIRFWTRRIVKVFLDFVTSRLNWLGKLYQVQCRGSRVSQKGTDGNSQGLERGGVRAFAQKTDVITSKRCTC